MKSKTLKMNAMAFTMMSETHLKFLAMQGIAVEITDGDYNTTSNEVAKPVSKNTASNKVEQAVKNNSKSKSSAKSKKNSKAGKTTGNKKPELAFGKNIKVGNFVKVLNLKDHKLVNCGKVKSLGGKIEDNEVDTRFVELTSGKKYALNHVISISESEFKKLAKTRKGVAKQKAKKEASTSTKLTSKDYKKCYAKHLLNLGKITEGDFNQVIKDDNALSELYHLYAESDEPVKLSNADALKIFADNAKANA